MTVISALRYSDMSLKFMEYCILSLDSLFICKIK